MLNLSYVVFLTVLTTAFGLLELDDDNFQNEIDKLDFSLVMFYAPWCGHCKRLKPEFDAAGEILKKENINLLKVDCTAGGKDTCTKFSVQGYPTLKIFKKGEFLKDYQGPREKDGIVKHMKSQVGPACREIKTAAELTEFLNTDEVTIFGYLTAGSDLENMLLKFADINREKYRCGYSNAEEILKLHKKDSIVLIRPKHLHNKFEDSTVDCEGKTASELEAFVKKHYHGLVGHRTRETVRDFDSARVVAYYNVDYIKDPKGTNYWRNRVLQVAKEYPEIQFAISAKDLFQDEINEYGYDYTGEKPLVLALDSKKQKYAMKEEFSVANLKAFVKKMLEGKLEPFIKSEPIPETNDKPVKVVVAKNFDEIVKNNEKDTLIEFYAPWCGHCKNLEPIYNELAEKLINEDITIAKMDATANDVPSEFKVSGFPTLYWLNKDKKDKPVLYNGGRDVKEFIKYIAKHASNELKGYDRNGKEKKTEL